MGVGPEGDAQAEALPVGLVVPSRCCFSMGRGTGLGFNDLTEEEDILLWAHIP